MSMLGRGDIGIATVKIAQAPLHCSFSVALLSRGMWSWSWRCERLLLGFCSGVLGAVDGDGIWVLPWVSGKQVQQGCKAHGSLIRAAYWGHIHGEGIFWWWSVWFLLELSSAHSLV